MLYSLLYDLLRLLIEILIVRGRGEARLRAEVLGCGISSGCWSAKWVDPSGVLEVGCC